MSAGRTVRAPRAALVHACPEAEGLRFSVLSDLSANVFAALLLILILLLQLRVAADRADRPLPPPEPLDASADLGAAPHRPLAVPEILTMLRARGPRAPGLSLDLGPRGLGMPDGDGGERWSKGAALLPALAEALEGAESGPVRLYVFANRDVPAVSAALAAAGRRFTDLSVPRALRDRATGGEWSRDFLALAAAPGSEAAFREGLARLLAQDPGPLAPGGRVASGGGGAAEGAGEAPGGGGSTVTGLLHAAAVALGAAALLGGLGAVIVIERRGRAS